MSMILVQCVSHEWTYKWKHNSIFSALVAFTSHILDQGSQPKIWKVEITMLHLKSKQISHVWFAYFGKSKSGIPNSIRRGWEVLLGKIFFQVKAIWQRIILTIQLFESWKQHFVNSEHQLKPKLAWPAYTESLNL